MLVKKNFFVKTSIDYYKLLFFTFFLTIKKNVRITKFVKEKKNTKMSIKMKISFEINNNIQGFT